MKNLMLKTIVLIAAIGMISYNAMAGKDYAIPQAVTTAFSAKYAQAKVNNWKMKNDTCIASFTLNKKKYMAYYSKDGNWVSTERNIRHRSTLPVQAQHFLKTGKFASWYVDGMKKVTTPTEDMFVVHVDNHSGSKIEYENVGSAIDLRLCFNDNGQLIKTN